MLIMIWTNFLNNMMNLWVFSNDFFSSKVWLDLKNLTEFVANYWNFEPTSTKYSWIPYQYVRIWIVFPLFKETDF